MPQSQPLPPQTTAADYGESQPYGRSFAEGRFTPIRRMVVAFSAGSFSTPPTKKAVRRAAAEPAVSAFHDAPRRLRRRFYWLPTLSHE